MSRSGFLALFLASLAGQAIAGWHDYNNLETWHAQMAGETPETLSLGRYVTTSSFAQAVTENWQSEYLQFTLFILLTVWFVQKGSPESKQPGEEGELAGARDGDDLDLVVVRAVGERLEREQRHAARARAAVALAGVQAGGHAARHDCGDRLSSVAAQAK